MMSLRLPRTHLSDVLTHVLDHHLIGSDGLLGKQAPVMDTRLTEPDLLLTELGKVRQKDRLKWRSSLGLTHLQMSRTKRVTVCAVCCGCWSRLGYLQLVELEQVAVTAERGQQAALFRSALRPSSGRDMDLGRNTHTLQGEGGDITRVKLKKNLFRLIDRSCSRLVCRTQTKHTLTKKHPDKQRHTNTDTLALCCLCMSLPSELSSPPQPQASRQTWVSTGVSSDSSRVLWRYLILSFLSIL